MLATWGYGLWARHTCLMNKSPREEFFRRGRLFVGDVLASLDAIRDKRYQLIVADPPYFQVLKKEGWDNQWKDQDEYLNWTESWAAKCDQVLKDDGLFYVFGQVGKREHVWLHVCSMLTRKMQFHDMLIWDRAVGYNDRQDSFTPQYEMVLVLRKKGSTKTYFDKNAVRISYGEETIQDYLRDKRYKDKVAREKHLRAGKYATNIIRIPSLKGSSKEKAGHPSQKPFALIEALVKSSSRPGDHVLDPFLGSGTTAVACESLGRNWDGIEISEDYVSICRKRLADAEPDNALLAG